jgi:hypothetical protein
MANSTRFGTQYIAFCMLSGVSEEGYILSPEQRSYLHFVTVHMAYHTLLEFLRLYVKTQPTIHWF